MGQYQNIVLDIDILTVLQNHNQANKSNDFNGMHTFPNKYIRVMYIKTKGIQDKN